jgi:hypothetical protein
MSTRVCKRQFCPCYRYPELLHDYEVPEYLATNKYLRFGYRKCDTSWDCLRSLQTWSISQLSSITSLLTFIMGIALIYVYLPEPESQRPAAKVSEREASELGDIRRWMVVLMGLNAALHSLPSAGYHVFGESVGMGKASFIQWQRFDFIMIYISSIFLALALGMRAYLTDASLWWTIPVSVGCVVICLCVVLFTIRATRLPIHRVLLLACLVFSYFIPMMALPSGYLLSAVLFLFVGAMLYMYNIPERFFPHNHFTHVSHGLMHICLQGAWISELLWVMSI